MRILFLVISFSLSALDLSLINQETGRIIVTFKDGKPHFQNRLLEEEMSVIGIQIPFLLAPEFDDRSVIYLHDPLFEKAFLEVYCPTFLSDTIYQWQK